MNLEAVSHAVQEIGKGLLRIQGEDVDGTSLSKPTLTGFGNTTTQQHQGRGRGRNQGRGGATQHEFWAWDVESWQKEHVHECVLYLLREAETEPSNGDSKRKAIAGRMLLYLGNQRPEASTFIVNSMESLVMKAFQVGRVAHPLCQLVNVATSVTITANLFVPSCLWLSSDVS